MKSAPPGVLRLIESVTRLRPVVVALGVLAGVLAFDASVADASVPGDGVGRVAYDDVPADAYYADAVASLGYYGVLAGTECAEGFCPDDDIDRKTMAVWIARHLDGPGPAAASLSLFDDVDPAGFHGPFIGRMADLGITRGCGGGSFCPDRPVTRAHMAVFLSRAFSLVDGPDPGFADVASDAWYAADVAKLVASGITRGCGDGTRFCPGRNTTRAQMATFLARVIEHLREESERRYVLNAERVGTETVTVYLCGPAGTYNDSMLSHLVESLNQKVAPFYEWQSSGLFKLTFAAGTVITTTQPYVEALSNRIYCLEATQTASPTLYSAMVMYIPPALIDDLRFGGLGGITSESYDVCHGRGGGEWPCTLLMNTVAHETDHSVLWIPHVYPTDPVFGYTRGWFDRTGDGRFPLAVWSPANNEQFKYEDGVLTDLGGRWSGSSDLLAYAFTGDHAKVPEGQFNALSCKSRAFLKWPTGPGRPVCAKSLLLTPAVFGLARDGPSSVRVEPTGFRRTLNPFVAHSEDRSAIEGYYVRLTQRVYLAVDDLDSQADAEALVKAAVAPRNIRDRCAPPASPTPVQNTDPCVSLVAFWNLEDGGGRVEYWVDSWHRYSGDRPFVIAGIIPDSVVSAEVYAFSSDQVGSQADLELGMYTTAVGEVQIKNRSSFSADGAPSVGDLNYEMIWPEYHLAVEYRIRGLGRQESSSWIEESGRFWINGWGQGLEFGTTYNITIDACITAAGVSSVVSSQGTRRYSYTVSCHEYIRTTLTTPSEESLLSQPACEAHHLVPGSNAPSASPSNVVVLDVWNTEANLSWDPVPCANYYAMLTTSPVGGGSTVSAEQFRERPVGAMGHLAANTAYTVEVWACNWELDESGLPVLWAVGPDRCSKSAPVQFTTTG